jgi:hypothetical protein
MVMGTSSGAMVERANERWEPDVRDASKIQDPELVCELVSL